MVEAQKQGFIVTGSRGRDLKDDFLGFGLGVDPIYSEVPVHVRGYVECQR